MTSSSDGLDTHTQATGGIRLTTVTPPHADRRALRFALFGGPPDTGNLGVSALGLATIAGLGSGEHHTAAVTVFDNGRGCRRDALETSAGTIGFVRRGAWHSRRLHRGESLLTMDWLSRVAPYANANLRTLSRADAVLDISGGDSFCDLYGPKRFEAVTLPKRLALRLGRPLVLLPQTYGPFRDPHARRVAVDVLRRSAQVWTRDLDSHERLAELLDGELDPERHRQGVDVAFALPPREPARLLTDLRGWLDDPDPVVGVNVSGLLFNDPAPASARFGLRADYPTAIRALIDTLLKEGCRILLVPHVRGDMTESDDPACARLVHESGADGRIAMLPAGMDACETKWAIAQLDWFTGARMHATIAALSSEVPAAATAYSHKTHGVFASCGIGDQVADARSLSTGDLIDALLASYDARGRVAARLQEHAPPVRARAVEQLHDIVRGVLDGEA